MTSFDSYLDPPDDNSWCPMCFSDDKKCVCEECQVCGEVGNPSCYKEHGMQATEAMMKARRQFEADQISEAEAETQIFTEEAEAVNDLVKKGLVDGSYPY